MPMLDKAEERKNILSSLRRERIHGPLANIYVGDFTEVVCGCKSGITTPFPLIVGDAVWVLYVSISFGSHYFQCFNYDYILRVQA